jgi:hypothetical protein
MAKARHIQTLVDLTKTRLSRANSAALFIGLVATGLLFGCTANLPDGPTGVAKTDAKPSEPSSAPTGTAAGFEFINTSFENASPLHWEVDQEGVIQVYLVYDQERSSCNRANGHWHFKLQGKPGSKLTVVLNNLNNIYNGRMASPASDKTITFVSTNGHDWKPMATEFLQGSRLQISVTMPGPELYVARLEPYRISDLNRLLESIKAKPNVEISQIGKTVEGRDLEIVRVGKVDAPYRVFLRARAHAWEPGGNWVVQGIIHRLLKDDETAKNYLERYCIYVMPMANKDGVARGRTRFNMQGKDLNRNWDVPADPTLAPENYAIEEWVKTLIKQGRRPDLALDLHNDEGGRLHISHPEHTDLKDYLARMKMLENLLRERTWFTEGVTDQSFHNPGTIGEGLLARYGIDAAVHELNGNWIKGLKDYPTSKNWELYGEQLCQVFYEYFGVKRPGLEVRGSAGR